jgi:hypothetical protein
VVSKNVYRIRALDPAEGLEVAILTKVTKVTKITKISV